MSLKSFFLLLPVLPLLSSALLAQGQDYIWPTNASEHLTSTFGETRSAHYHSGLDIKTWGREGYKVFASKDGIVYRLGVSVEGYGKVIYLKHDDGSFTVYAHLQRMNNELQAYVDSVRMLDYSFEINLDVEKLNIRVNQGDVIGYTGSTGVGPPHLHFEIRDPNDKPINALRSNLKVQDNLQPTLSSLSVFPLSMNSSIRSSKYPQLYYPIQNLDGVTDFGIIEASGPIGLAVSAYDEAEKVTNKYAVYELGLILEEDTLFFERLDEFWFEEDDVMFTDRLPAFGSTRRSFQTLFKKDGPENPFYKIVDNRVSIIPSSSPTEFTIFAKDYYGNETLAKVSVVQPTNSPKLADDSIEKPMHEWYWTEDWVNTGKEIIDFESFDFGINWDTSLSQKISFNENHTILWSRYNPKNTSYITSPDQRLSIWLPKATVFDTLTVATYTSSYNDYPYINVQPGMIPSRKEFGIEYFLDDIEFELGNNYRLFRIDRLRDRISYVDSKLIGKTVHGWPSNFGEFLILPDNEVPDLDTPKIVQTDFGKWFVYISAIDSLSGINFQQSEIYVNDVRGIVEYDNEEDLLIYYHPDFIPKNKNVVSVKIQDKAGNIFTGSYQL